MGYIKKFALPAPYRTFSLCGEFVFIHQNIATACGYLSGVDIEILANREISPNQPERN